MSPEPPQPRALVLVRNTVTHDNRVLREADTLSQLGFSVLVAGVMSSVDREKHIEIDGTRVLRLDPGGALRDRLGRGSPPRRTPHEPQPVPEQPGSSLRTGQRRRARRLALNALYLYAGARLAWRQSPDLVHANDYNTMWVGIIAKLLRGSALVYDCHELWADRNGRPEWRPWLIACEALFVRVADLTITASPGYAEELARRYRIPAPLVVRNIPADASGVGAGSGGSAISDESSVAVYVGGLLPGRGLEPAIDALALVPELRLRVIGPGSDRYRSQLLARAQAVGVADRLELAGAVPPGAVVSSVAGADLGLMLIQPVCRSYELTLPNKLFEYTAAGLPVLASDLPVIGGIVRDNEIGEVTPPADVRRIASAMRRLADPDHNQHVRERVRTFAARFTWEHERQVLAGGYGKVYPHVPPRTASCDPAPDVSDVYARYAASPRRRRSWSADNVGNVAIRAELADAIFALAGVEIDRAERILDVGCGTGWWLALLAERPQTRAELFGVDVLRERAAAARRRAPSAEIEPGDARRLPYGEERFDVVTLLTVLSSLAGQRDVEAVLREAKRVLTPRGVVLIWEPRWHNPANRATTLIGPDVPARAFPGWPLETRTTTVLPPLARHLGQRTDRIYPWLTRFGPLHSHRLTRVGPRP